MVQFLGPPCNVVCARVDESVAALSSLVNEFQSESEIAEWESKSEFFWFCVAARTTFSHRTTWLSS